VGDKHRKLWVEETCSRLAEIERQTQESLGEEGDFFVNVANDWIEINSALIDAYPGELGHTLVVHTFQGLFKEVWWFQFLFVSGNYPLLLSRLRFIWESVFRAYFAEHYPLGPPQSWPAPGPSPDDKLAWLEKHERYLNWNRCIEPTLRAVFPLADREHNVREYYLGLWQKLHKYVHPSTYLAGKMIGESLLHVTDNFDEEWAREVFKIASTVFDLVWLAVLGHHPDAFDRLEKVFADYPILKVIFMKESKQ